MATEQQLRTSLKTLHDNIVLQNTANTNLIEKNTHLNDVHKVTGLHYKVGNGFIVNEITKATNILVTTTFSTEITEILILDKGTILPTFEIIPNISHLFVLEYRPVLSDIMRSLPNVVVFTSNNWQIKSVPVSPYLNWRGRYEVMVGLGITPSMIKDGKLVLEIISYYMVEDEILEASLLEINNIPAITGTATPLLSINNNGTYKKPFIISATYINSDNDAPDKMTAVFTDSNNTIQTFETTDYSNDAHGFYLISPDSLALGEYTVSVSVKGKNSDPVTESNIHITIE